MHVIYIHTCHDRQMQNYLKIATPFFYASIKIHALAFCFVFFFFQGVIPRERRGVSSRVRFILFRFYRGGNFIEIFPRQRIQTVFAFSVFSARSVFFLLSSFFFFFLFLSVALSWSSLVQQ